MEHRILWVVAGCALFGMAPRAHHAISAVYDDSKRMTLNGVVAQFQFVNPHPFVVTDVMDADGRPQRWRLEMDNLRELADIGFTDQTLRPGDRIVVVGSPARSQSKNLYIRRLDRRSDGFWYEQIGGTPAIRPPSSDPESRTKD